MKAVGALVVSAALAFGAGAAKAGVVIDEQVTMAGGRLVQNQTLMVQGHQEKLVNDRRVVVVDLDKGTLTSIRQIERPSSRCRSFDMSDTVVVMETACRGWIPALRGWIPALLCSA